MAGTLSQGAQSVLYGLVGKTIIYKNAEANNNTVTLHTVTAGKTFYLLTASLSWSGSGTASLELSSSANRILVAYSAAASGLTGNTYIQPIPIPQNTPIQVTSSEAAMNCIAAVIGWED